MLRFKMRKDNVGKRMKYMLENCWEITENEILRSHLFVVAEVFVKKI